MNEETENCGCEKRHDHVGPWWGIGVPLALVIVVWYLTFMIGQHQFDVIYDRVGEMRRQLDCPPGELYVTDHDGVEYCLNPSEEESE